MVRDWIGRFIKYEGFGAGIVEYWQRSHTIRKRAYMKNEKRKWKRYTKNYIRVPDSGERDTSFWRLCLYKIICACGPSISFAAT